MRNLTLVALGWLAVLPGLAQAQSAATSPTLLEAWLAWQEERQASQAAPFDWAYSFALRANDALPLEQRRRRLVAELEVLSNTLELARDTDRADALTDWQRGLSSLPAEPARSPERLGLPHLASDLRRNPAMADIAALGTCTPPAWIETWTLEGVDRLRWTPGMSVEQALDALPGSATKGIDRVTLVTPLGETRDLGIAAWNHEGAPLAPGSRLVSLLPERGLGGTAEGDIVNRELAAWLATRLPGDDCTIRDVE
ncbi:capsule biosynthesis GfcC family protein [Halomonas sp. M4R1S46]|uniref:capsule biosynthesis GfcC family protein n=1 Tax=Halomonas sp. M4R1S46 TaxID=2982692 RepID=UPI0021E3993C|nr:capsule biosynthesis GfcC family protein [Halomonas sp. M4R1S46]UYG06076.1 capsule biosynthesis GfcC family protein [Halomonas sp. M4R1S46]